MPTGMNTAWVYRTKVFHYDSVIGKTSFFVWQTVGIKTKGNGWTGFFGIDNCSHAWITICFFNKSIFSSLLQRSAHVLLSLLHGEFNRRVESFDVNSISAHENGLNSGCFQNFGNSRACSNFIPARFCKFVKFASILCDCVHDYSRNCGLVSQILLPILSLLSSIVTFKISTARSICCSLAEEKQSRI